MLIFDEVDAGIGGSTAQAVGRLLKQLSKSTQLLVVTHSPQIAALADHHFKVQKITNKDEAFTCITSLDDQEKTHEVARMLSGENITKEALAQAEKLRILHE